MKTRIRKYLAVAIGLFIVVIIGTLFYLAVAREPNLHTIARPSNPTPSLFVRNRPDRVPLPGDDDRFVTFERKESFAPEREEIEVNLGSPNSSRTVPVDFDPGTVSLLGVRPDLRLLSTDLELRSREANQIASLAIRVSGTQSPSPAPVKRDARLKIYEVGLYPSLSPLRTHTVKYNGQYTPQMLALSPDGEHLVWLVWGHYRSPLQELLASLNPDLLKYLPDEDGQALWLSKWDGSDRHSIGFMRKSKTPISSVVWTADGRDISFVYDERQWVVTAK